MYRSFLIYKHSIEYFNTGRVYALYNYDRSMHNINIRSRFDDRHIKVNEGDELEIIDDDEEDMWKVK